jgi:hypothetical protein
MGTKKNPAKYDCYANADPNEPMFILLGRDVGAYSLVEAWANARESSGENPAVVAEARACAAAMKAWHTELVTVCDQCLQASCWQGEFYCQEYKTAGTKQMTRKELAKLGRENSDYWMPEKVS